MQKWIFDPAPPKLPGLAWRPITRDDVAALVALAAECHRADGGLAKMIQPGRLVSRYLPDAAGAAIGAFDADGRLVAAASVQLVREADTHRAMIFGQVRPEQRRRGMGTYLMGWSQAQAQALLPAAAGDR